MTDISTKAKDQFDSTTVICPYCEYAYQPDSESYDEDERVEACAECDMKFHRSDTFFVDHSTRGDCELNGKQHAFKLEKLRAGNSAYFCENCGCCKLTKEVSE